MKNTTVLPHLVIKISNSIMLYAAFCFITLSGNAQKETYNWHFGSHCYVSFLSGSPVALPGGALNSVTNQEGCSDMSDAAGNVLFYTDGISVWDSSNTLMPNGTGLMAHFSTSQAALIVPMPGNAVQYYVFSLEEHSWPYNRLWYSIVDMTLNSGKGDVVAAQKNIIAADSMTEKQIAVRHSNGTDYWLITHKRLSDEFQCYLISAAGISANPVISHAGITILYDDAVGCIKANRSGTKIGCAYWYGSEAFEVYDFDNNTGLISNPVLFQDIILYHGAYSLEFSPNEQYFYGTCFNSNTLYQFDLQSPSSPGLLLSNLATHGGDILMAPDKKIYVSLSNSNYLGVINNPDLAGTACNFVENGFNLGSNFCQVGLPNMIHDLISFVSVNNPVDDGTHAFTIFPNPANESITISSQFGLKEIEIYNLLGEKVFHRQLTTANCRITTADYPNGIYILKAITDKGVFQQKLLVSH